MCPSINTRSYPLLQTTMTVTPQLKYVSPIIFDQSILQLSEVDEDVDVDADTLSTGSADSACFFNQSSSGPFSSGEGDELRNKADIVDVDSTEPQSKEGLRSVLVSKDPTSPIEINVRGPWKRLPPPDLAEINRQTTARVASQVSSDNQNVQKKVSFDTLQIRSYAQTVGDNPSVSCGTPVQLDWNYSEQPAIAIDDYEAVRKDTRKTSMRRFMLNYYQRKNILSYYCGCSEEEIRKVEREIDKIRAQRKMTATLSPVWRVEDFLESAVRKSKRCIHS